MLYRYVQMGSGGYPGLSPITNLSWMQERFAKTVTSLIYFIDRVTVSANFIVWLIVQIEGYLYNNFQYRVSFLLVGCHLLVGSNNLRLLSWIHRGLVE